MTSCIGIMDNWDYSGPTHLGCDKDAADLLLQIRIFQLLHWISHSTTAETLAEKALEK